MSLDFVYIVSPSFSGSTLLTFLLSTHPKIATVGELKATSMDPIDKYRCSCGEPILTCSFWRRVTSQLESEGIPFSVSDFGTHFRFRPTDSLSDRLVRARVGGRAFESMRRLGLRFLPGAHHQLRDIVDRNRALVDAVCRLRGVSVFLDASKEPNRLLYLADSQLWRVKVIYLVRDGRGVTQSVVKRLLKRSLPGSARPGALRSAARHWRQVNESCERVLSRLSPDAWVRVRYEDLCRDPSAAIGPALDLLGVEPIDIANDFRETEHHILGNYMRLGTKGIRLDEQWREIWDAADNAIFQREAGDMNSRHGYAP